MKRMMVTFFTVPIAALVFLNTLAQAVPTLTDQDRCEKQAKAKFSDLHFLARRDFVRKCMRKAKSVTRDGYISVDW